MENLCARCGKKCRNEIVRGERLAYCSLAPEIEREKQADIYLHREVRRGKRKR